MNKLFALILSLLLSVGALAQTWTISGKIIDKTTNEAIQMAAVRLMKADSSYVDGIATSDLGIFILKPQKGGKYILKMSSIGYKTIYRNVNLTKDTTHVALGSILMESNDISLKGAGITAKAAKVEVRGDTFVYNASAYRVPEGAYLETLIDKLPGVVVGDDGSITLNGKTVSQIRVDGKDFFKGDKSVAMKNLPADMVSKIKSYEKKSDYTEQTGIDDGNEETVIDLELKQKLKRAWFSNADLALGNKDRYSGQLFANGMNDVSRVSFFGNMNNTNSRGFRGGGPGFRGGGNGLQATKNFGLDAFWNNGKEEKDAGFFEIGGNIGYTYNGSDNSSRSNSETFLTSESSSFANSRSKNMSSSRGVRAEGNIRWNIDSLTTMRFRPSFSYNNSNSNSNSRNVTFNSDPFDISSSPLDSMFQSLTDPTLANSELAAIAVNRNRRTSLSKSNSSSFSGEMNLTHRFMKPGRSISLRLSGDYSNSHSRSFSLNDIYYYQRSQRTISNQYSVSPSKNWNYSARLSYSEPILKNLFLQTSYNYEHRYQDQDRTLYQLDSLDGFGRGDVYPRYPLGYLPSSDSLLLAKNYENSRYATYHDDIHTVNVGLRYVNDAINFSLGVRMQPQHTKLDYQKDQLDTTVTRSVFNVSPDVRLRYKITNMSQLELRYRGSSSQPSMTNLLDITDSSDPLNISRGNPGLKPSWTNSLNVDYRNYLRASQTSYSFRANYSNTRNSVSNAVVYDEETGVRTSRPENINGNWNAGVFGMISSSFSDDSPFSVFNMVNYDYSNAVGYMSVMNQSSQKNTTKTSSVSDRLRGSFRTGLFEVGLNGSIRYQHSKNKLQSQANLDTYNFAYGGNIQYTSDFGLSISTDMSMNSRRGYSDKSMNTNELLWNAQLSQSFLKGKAATISIQFYDILHRQSNVSRSITAQMSMDTRTNAINSYFMVHFIYRFNSFGTEGGSNNRGGGRRGGWGGGPGGPGGFGGPGPRR